MPEVATIPLTRLLVTLGWAGSGAALASRAGGGRALCRYPVSWTGNGPPSGVACTVCQLADKDGGAVIAQFRHHESSL